MQNELTDKYVKVYSNCRTKYGYIGDAKILKILKHISDDLYNCDLVIDDEICTYTISENDILY